LPPDDGTGKYSFTKKALIKILIGWKNIWM